MKQRNCWKEAAAILGVLLALLSSGARAQTPSEEAAATVSLDSLVAEALEQNPGVQAAARRVAALRRRAPQAQSLPDPTVSVGWMGDVKPFGVMRDDPSSYRALSAMQEIPYPAKLRLRGQLADREAEAAWWDYEALRRQVVADIKSAYFEYSFARTAIDITLKNQDLLERLARIAETRYRVGKGLQQDVLKSHVELSRLRQRLTLLEQESRTAQGRLNTLRVRDPEAPLGPPAPLAPVELTYMLETLYQLARENDTGLRREERQIARQQVAVNLARKEYYPDFGVGYMYQNRPLLPEMHGFTFSLNIPVFYRARKEAGIEEATEELRAAERTRADRETTLTFKVKEEFLAARASQELYRLYSQAIVPQSSLALESALAAYEVGSVDFLTVIENFSTVLDFEVDYYRELADYLSALARLEPLVGVELTK
jgi:outer membrane protein TolC